VRILQLPDVKERLLALGAEPAPTTPDEFGKTSAVTLLKKKAVTGKGR
jgi:hypothetical protein